MHYLSVHDLVWINATVTGKTLSFDYETLEAAMAAQYSYGDSTQTALQASNLLRSLLFKPPFVSGNRRTAFVAVITYLNANGYGIIASDSDAAQIVNDCAKGTLSADAAVAKLASPSNLSLGSGPQLRALVTHVFNQHSAALESLSSGD